MTDKQQPEALRLAELLTADEWPGHMTLVSYARECVAELRRLHAENETLRMGYAAARLEIESLRAGGAGPSPASQAEAVLINGLTAEETFATASCSGLTEPRPVTAYAALPVTPQFPAHPEPMVMAWSAIEISVIAQYGRDMYEAGKRASHGQAPAQAAPAAVAGPLNELEELNLLNKLITLGSKAAHAHAQSNSDDGHKGTAAYVQWQEMRAEMGELIRAAYAAPTTQPAPQQEAPADELEEVLRERDDAEDFINELLDEVLGADRPEWSSAYNRYDAMSDVRERITALHKPVVDKAWGRFESAMAAPQSSPAAQGDALDAARWHWLAEYLVGPRTDLDDEIVASETVNDLRKLVDAARAVLARWGQPAHSGEPVATVKGWTNGSYWRNYQVEFHREDLPAGTKLYTAPQPMEREPLTPEQRSAAFARAEKKMQSNINLSWRDAIADEIEAAHGIKGGQP